jgi:hypothetical protein
MSLSPPALEVKRALGKRGQSAGAIAAKLNRPGKGTGPILSKLVREGLAARNDDGTYSKAA